MDPVTSFVLLIAASLALQAAMLTFKPAVVHSADFAKS